MGAYHTLDLELNRKFTLGKHEWDTVALERIGNNEIYNRNWTSFCCTFYCTIITSGSVILSVMLQQSRS